MSDSRGHARTAELTTKGHWDDAWSAPPRWRLPSPLFVTTRNMQRLLRPHVQPGTRVLELGCAPGKILAWTAAVLGADVSGVDYSARGIAWTRHLFEALRLRGDLRCEDVLRTTFEPGSFDVVYSFGLVEHFQDPRPLVRAHVALAKPGGLVLIAVPHYGGVYGRLQRWFDRDNLALHNLDVMSVAAMAGLAPPDLTERVRAYPAGRLSPWLISIERRVPSLAARAVHYAVNAVALLQPVEIRALCPFLVLEITRRADPC